MTVSFALSHWSEQSETSQWCANHGHAVLYESLLDLETLLDTKLDFLRGVDRKKLCVTKFRIKRIGLSQNRYFEGIGDAFSSHYLDDCREKITKEFADRLENIKRKYPYLKMTETADPNLINQTVSYANWEAFQDYDSFYADEYRNACRQTTSDSFSTIWVRTKLYRPLETGQSDNIGNEAKLQCFELIGFEVGFQTLLKSLKHHFPLSIEKLLRITKVGK